MAQGPLERADFLLARPRPPLTPIGPLLGALGGAGIALGLAQAFPLLALALGPLLGHACQVLHRRQAIN